MIIDCNVAYVTGLQLEQVKSYKENFLVYIDTLGMSLYLCS